MQTTLQTLPRLQDQRQDSTDTRPSDDLGGAHAASIIPARCATCPATADASTTAPSPPAAPARPTARKCRAPGGLSLIGFSLIELLAVLSMTGVLTSVALPTFEGQLQRARRSDVLVTMMQVQAAQERWRSNGARYGSLAEIGAPAASATGHYRLQVRSADEEGYDVLATATGAQARDAGCRHMSLRVTGANLAYASGPDANVANPAPLNAKCWSL